MLEETTHISEDLEVAQDAFSLTAGKYPGNILSVDDKASSAVLDKYSKYAGDPPDGGAKAWFGYINTWGLYQDYYECVLLPDSGPSTIAWIGSTQYALMFIPGLFIGRLFDLGYLKLPYFIANYLLLICVFLTAECTQYWQFFLAQGLGGGLASGILFGPAVGVIHHWFLKRSGLALRVFAVGSSIGGTIFPIVGQNLIPLVRFKWTIRVFGFILLIALGIGNITIDRKLPPMNALGGLFNWAAFHNPAYTVYCIAGIFCFLGIYTEMTYLSVYAAEIGVTNKFAFYLVAIANASSGVGSLTKTT
ncbi:hypothetical protein SCLCIDRAFT_33224 [Scleroderma citrinum Foug A]|uniref:Major facilitator superfamily (MFS) profile domain-containing protein n=1 Tax=Scleroderma citrinum Foug A TaxID=1036808 RepID=A0A0C3CT00_9AGAM|nr:hypothetical protein SCLCIDRAFT_33224 [Scleroderma citrinum Foug A]